MIAATLDRYTGTDPESLLAVEAYLAATRDEQRERIDGLVDEARRRLGRWLGRHGVGVPDETAGVLLATTDGLLFTAAWES